jgi:hypothetical protein
MVTMPGRNRTKRLAAVLAVLAGLALTSNAAGTQWFYEGHAIPVGQTVEVPAHGTLKLYLRDGQPTLIETSCAATGTEAFWNTTTTGMDETKAITLSCTAPCGAVTFTPELPWSSVLLAPAPFALPDEWSGVRVHFACGATDYGVFTGTLKPVSGDGDEQAKDEPDSFLDFRVGQRLAGSGRLTLTFVGYYKLGYTVGRKKVDVITGQL